MRKKILSLLLVTSMFLTLLSGAMPTFADDSAQAAPFASEMKEEKSEARQELEREAGSLYQEDEEVGLIVKLKAEDFSEFGAHYTPAELEDKNLFVPQTAFAKKANEKALSIIKEKGIEFQLLYTLDLIMLGFTGNASYGDALKIADLPFVESVKISKDYDMPSAEEEPVSRMIYSNRLIKQDKIYGQYDGSGMLVAVIDSGIDYEHPAFYLTDKGKTAKKIKVENQTELDALKASSKIETKGVYLSEKVPFAYNYFDRNNDIKDLGSMHGQHVSGTVAGNRQELPTGETFMGVAPEAQLLALRVFGKSSGGTSEKYYVAAINDAVKLGADSINMSLGSPAGQTSHLSGSTIDSIKAAAQIGCIVAIAAGNESQFGAGVDKPIADYPDYGIMGSPAIAELGLAVASSQNTHVAYLMASIKKEDESVEKIPYTISKQPASFVENTFYETVDAKKALSDDEIPDNVSGKIALIERGQDTFANKVERAYKKGAVGAMIYNPADKEDASFGMAGLDKSKIPAISIKRSDALKLIEHATWKVSVSMETGFLPSETAGQISDFSNWGLTADGDFKPDIMAPGGNIYSTLNDGQYGDMSGTSMATPHVAGGIALIRSRVNKEFASYSGLEKFQLLRNLLMSTAEPHLNKNGILSSPRNQGSGIMNLQAAANTKAVMYDENTHESKLALKNVGDEFNLDFVVENLGNDTLSYSAKVYVITDEVYNGRITLRPQLVKEFNSEDISVEAKEKKKVHIPVNVAQEIKDLKLEQDMPNGFFLEGFVVLESKSGDAHLSVPFVGFHGNFENLAAVEPFINNLAKQNKKPFYFDPALEGTKDGNVHFTHLSSSIDEIVDGKKVSRKVILGQADNFDPVKNYAFTTPAVSPNRDKKLDGFDLRATYLRNIDWAKGRIYALNAEGNKEGNAIDAFTQGSIKKHHFSANPNNKKSEFYLIEKTSLFSFGKVDFNALKDGKYLFEIEAKPTAKDSKTLLESVEFFVDRVKPGVKDGKWENGTFSFEVIEQSGLYSELVYYIKDGKEIFLQRDKAGQYIVPEGQNPDDIKIVLTDNAQNKIELTAKEVLEGVVNGSIEVKAEVSPSGEKVPSYKVKVFSTVGEGKEVNKDEVRAGKYRVEVSGYAKEYILENEEPIYVEVTKENPNPTLVLRFKKVPTNTVTVTVDKASYTGSFKVYAINDEINKEYELTTSWFGPSNDYYDKVPYGTYRFDIRGLKGYHAEFTPDMAEVSATSSPKVNAVLVEGEGKPKTGTLSLEFIDNNKKSVEGVEYELRNEKNELVTVLSGLAFGKYTVEIKKFNTEKYELAKADRKQTVVLSENNPRVKVSFVFTKKIILDGKAKVLVNFWRLVPNKKDIVLLGFGKRYSVYAIHPVTGKKIYGTYKESTKLPIPDFLLGKYKTLAKKLGIKLSLNDVYEIELPTEEDGTAYRIQARCKNRGLATVDSYCDITVKAGTESKIGFQVTDAAEPVKIVSTFADGKNRDVEYVAIKKSNPFWSGGLNPLLGALVFSGKNGAEIKDMSRLAEGATYKILPSYIPEGFEASPAEYTVTGKKKGTALEPLKFEYTRKNKAAVQVRFKTGFFRKPQGNNPYKISIFDADNKKLSLKSAKVGKNTYEFVIPAGKEEKTYKVEVLCRDEEYVLRHTYKKVTVKENETKKLDFDVQKAEPLNIESSFSDGEEREVKYIASFGDDKAGASYEGVSPLKLYPGQTYTVKPVNIPEEFTIDVEEQKTSSNFLGTVFKPMRFKYTKKTSTKILVEIKGKTNYKAEAEVFALGTDGKRYKGLRNTDGNYEIYVPAAASGTKFKVEAQSLENKFTLKDTYKTVEVKDKEEAKLEFELVRSSVLEIETVFPEGTAPKPEVSYVAAREDNTEERGAVYTDMTKLYKESKYKVYPSAVPKGYLVKPETQTTEKVKKGWWLFKKDGFKPMSFTFEKKPMAKLTLEAKLKDSEEALEGVGFEIENEEGRKLTEEEWKESIELGKYKVTVLFDETRYELAEGEKTREVVLDKDGEEKTVSFLFEKTVKGSLILKAVDEKENDITKEISFTVKQGDQIINQLMEMKLGEYVVEAVYNEENYKLQEEQKNPVTVNLTKENKDVEYTFKFNKVNPLPPTQDKGKLTVRVSRYGKIADFDKISIYIVDKNHNKISTPEWTTKIESSWLLGDAMVYSAELPVAADGTEYIVQADCNIDGKGFWLNNYEKIKLSKKGKTVSFSLDEAKPLNVISNFTDGVKHIVKYKAEGGTADKGFYITDMNRLCAVNKYKISPVEVPSGYTVTPEFQEAKYDYGLKKFPDLEFKYSPKNANP